MMLIQRIGDRCLHTIHERLIREANKLLIIKRQYFKIVRYHLNIYFHRNCERRDVWWCLYHRNDTATYSLEPNRNSMWLSIDTHWMNLNEASSRSWGVHISKNETVSFCVCMTFTAYHLNTATTWQKVFIRWMAPAFSSSITTL